MAEWILELQALDFTVEHIAGRMNIGSDALSRLALEATSMEESRQGLAINERSVFEAAALIGHVMSNELVDAESRHSESVHLGLAADSVAQADYDMTSVSVYAAEDDATLVHEALRECVSQADHDNANVSIYAAEVDNPRRIISYLCSSKCLPMH